jgi:uncharacterized membrane protein
MVVFNLQKIEGFINQRTSYVLCGILVLSLLLRLYHINFQSLWLDELYSIVPTAPENSLQSVIEYSKADQPPLFFIYIHYIFKIFGYNEIVGRIACAFIGLLSIPVIYFLGKECQGKLTGLFAALLTGINYFHIYYSQELRFYTMAFFFASLSYLFYIRAFKYVRLIDFIGYTVSTICLLYTHYFGLIVVGTQALTFLILLKGKRNSKFVLLSISAAIVTLVALIPWTPVILNDIGVDVGWIKTPSPGFIAQYLYDYTGKDMLTTIIFITLLYFSFKSIKEETDANQKWLFFILIVWIVLTYLVPYVRSIVVSPMLHSRYTIVTLPAWITLFAFGWTRISKLKWKYSIPLILVLSFMVNMTYFKRHYTNLIKEQYREVSQIVISKNVFNVPIYSSLSWHFSFYFRNNPIKVKDIGQVDFSHEQKFWLLQAHYSEEEMEAEVKSLKDFKVTERHNLFGANAILMARK